MNYFASQPVGLDFTSGSGFYQWVWIWKPHGPDSLLYHVIYTQPWHNPEDPISEKNLNSKYWLALFDTSQFLL